MSDNRHFFAITSILAMAIALVIGCYEETQRSPTGLPTLPATALQVETPADGTKQGENRATASPAVTPTNSIVEVTPRPTDSIIVVGTPVTEIPPGVIIIEAGIYTPHSLQRVRACPSVACLIQGMAGGGVPRKTQGLIVNELRQTWACIEVRIDVHGAQDCAGALMIKDEYGGVLGKYVRQ